MRERETIRVVGNLAKEKNGRLGNAAAADGTLLERSVAAVAAVAVTVAVAVAVIVTVTVDVVADRESGSHVDRDDGAIGSEHAHLAEMRADHKRTGQFCDHAAAA
jgi:hypothetical protein